MNSKAGGRMRRSPLRRIRVIQGRTLEEVAQVLGITHSTLARYERGTIPITVYRLQQLAQIYGVPLTDLLDDEPVQVQEVSHAPAP